MLYVAKGIAPFSSKSVYRGPFVDLEDCSCTSLVGILVSHEGTGQQGHETELTGQRQGAQKWV